MYVLECCRNCYVDLYNRCWKSVWILFEFKLYILINVIFLNLLCLLEEFSVDMIEIFLYYYFIIRIDVGLMRYCLCNMRMLKVLKSLYF